MSLSDTFSKNNFTSPIPGGKNNGETERRYAKTKLILLSYLVERHFHEVIEFLHFLLG